MSSQGVCPRTQNPHALPAMEVSLGPAPSRQAVSTQDSTALDILFFRKGTPQPRDPMDPRAGRPAGSGHMGEHTVQCRPCPATAEMSSVSTSWWLSLHKGPEGGPGSGPRRHERWAWASPTEVALRTGRGLAAEDNDDSHGADLCPGADPGEAEHGPTRTLGGWDACLPVGWGQSGQPTATPISSLQSWAQRQQPHQWFLLTRQELCPRRPGFHGECRSVLPQAAEDGLEQPGRAVCACPGVCAHQSSRTSMCLCAPVFQGRALVSTCVSVHFLSRRGQVRPAEPHHTGHTGHSWPLFSTCICWTSCRPMASRGLAL